MVSPQAVRKGSYDPSLADHVLSNPPSIMAPDRFQACFFSGQLPMARVHAGRREMPLVSYAMQARNVRSLHDTS